MDDLPYPTPENLSVEQKPNLLRSLSIIFVTFVFIGFGLGYLINKYIYVEKEVPKVEVAIEEEKPFEGTITYIDPNLHPQDAISYVLVDKSGKDVILLKAKDQKLEVAEGHFATLYGSVKKSSTKEEYLMVDRIVIKNVAN